MTKELSQKELARVISETLALSIDKNYIRKTDIESGLPTYLSDVIVGIFGNVLKKYVKETSKLKTDVETTQTSLEEVKLHLQEEFSNQLQEFVSKTESSNSQLQELIPAEAEKTITLTTKQIKAVEKKLIKRLEIIKKNIDFSEELDKSQIESLVLMVNLLQQQVDTSISEVLTLLSDYAQKQDIKKIDVVGEGYVEVNKKESKEKTTYIISANPPPISIINGSGTASSPTASNVSFVSSGNITSDNVQLAIVELDNEKASKSFVIAMAIAL